MFEFGILTIPILSLLAVFGLAVVTDVNMIAFDVKSVPEVARNMGFNEQSVRDAIMRKVHTISRVAATPRGVSYTTIGDVHNQTLRNISETLGITSGVVAAQGFLGLVPYHLKGKLVQEGDFLYLAINGFSRNNQSFNFGLKTDKDALESSQIIKGHLRSFRKDGETGTDSNTQLVITNTETEIKSLLDRGAGQLLIA